MIYVNQKQLDQVEYLIEQSSRGHHVLFDTSVIRDVFSRVEDDPELDSSDEEDAVIEKHIETLILQPTLVAKRAYLEKLDAKTFDRVVYTYFSIVENNIFEGMEFSN